MTTIETADQADALPVGTVIRTARDRVAEHAAPGTSVPWLITEFFGRSRLRDTDLPATVLHDPTQSAPASVIDREAAHLAGGKAYAEGGGPDDVVDAVIAALPTRTVAQVKAEALREAAAQLQAEDNTRGDWWDSTTQTYTTPLGWLNARADELEREDKR